MKKIIAFLLVIFLLACTLQVSALTKDIKVEEIKGEYVEGDVIVTVGETGLSPTSSLEKSLFSSSVLLYSDSDNIVETGKNLNTYSEGVYLLHSDKLSTSEIIANLKEDSSIINAEPNYIMHINSESETPDYTTYQYIASPDQSNVPDWNDPTNVNSEGIVVAVIDTGVNYPHEDLKDVMWDDGLNYPGLVALGGGKVGFNACAIVNTYDAHKSDDPLDVHMHGTHCAGIIAAKWNDYGVSGVCNGAEIMAIRVGEEDGSMPTAAIVCGYRYMIEAKKAGVNVKVANCSFGDATVSYSIAYMAQEAGDLGIISVYAAGNSASDNDIKYSDTDAHAQIPSVITVASSTKEFTLAPYSCYGIRTTDVMAPGHNILSTSNTRFSSSDPNLVDPDVCDDFSSNLFSYSCDEESYALTRINNDGYDDNNCIYLAETVKGDKYYRTFTIEYTDTQGLLDLDKPVFTQFRIKHDTPGNKLAITPADQGDLSRGDNETPVDENGWNSASILVPVEDINKETRTIKVPYEMKIFSNETSLQGVKFDNIAFTNEAVEYIFLNGTSMAAPFVTAEVALAYDKYPDEPIDKIKARIIGNVTKTNEITEKGYCRSGIVNVGKMLDGDSNDPVILKTEYTDTTLTLKGYFFDNVDSVTFDSKVASIVENTSEKIVVEIPNGLSSNEALIVVTTNEGREGRYMAKIGDENIIDRIDIDKSSDGFKTLSLLSDIKSLALDNKIYYLGKEDDKTKTIVEYDIKKNEYKVIKSKISEKMGSSLFSYDGCVCYIYAESSDDTGLTMRNIMKYSIDTKTWTKIEDTTPSEMFISDDLVPVVYANDKLYTFYDKYSLEEEGTAVWEIKFLENNKCSYVKQNGSTKRTCENLHAVSDDNGNIYLFCIGAMVNKDSLLEIISINDGVVESKKVYNPLLENAEINNNQLLRVTRTKDSILLIGAEEREDGKIVQDIYEMKFSQDKFTPIEKKVSVTQQIWGDITSYQGYTYFLAGASPNDEMMFLSKLPTSYYYPEYEKYALGDADGDLDLTIIDATTIQMYLANLLDAPKIKLGASDIDKDSDVTVLDSNKIQRILAQYEEN